MAILKFAPEIGETRRRILSLSRAEAEDLHTEIWERNDKRTLRWFIRNDRYFLLSSILGRDDLRNDWLYDRCREVEADPDDYIDVWAREHYKSTIITFAGIIQEILNDPEITICIFSHHKPAAKDFLTQIKREFEDNTVLLRLFPEILWANPQKDAPFWGEESGLVVKRKSNPKEATLEISGLIDGMATGKHFRLRAYDDIINEEMVTSPDMIKKVTLQWELSDNLGTRDGRVWLIGTRYHFADTYGVLLTRGAFKERRHAATDDGTFDGKPVFLSQKQWDLKRHRQSKPTIAAQQLLNPLAGTETKFDVRWLQYWRIRPKILNVYILIDPSKGKHATSDNTACAVIGVDVHRNMYLLDAWRHRMPLSRRYQLLKHVYTRWRKMPGIEGVYVGYEQYGMQTDLEFFEFRFRTENISIPIEELSWPKSGPKSKDQRIERLEPDIRMGRFRLPEVIEIDEEGNTTLVDPLKKKDVQQMIASNQRYRVAAPIRKKDEDDRLYDVVLGFMEEYTFFPFAPKNDLLDACSRIYDMEPSPPIAYDEEPGKLTSVQPEIYPDS